MNAPDIAAVIKRRMDLKASLEVQSKAYVEATKSENEALVACDQIILIMLNAQNVDSVKTEFGTAYRSTVTSATVDPDGGWERLSAFILAGALKAGLAAVENGAHDDLALEAAMQAPELQFLVRNVNKTAVTEFIEQNKVEPPGVKLTSIIRANVRKS